MSERVLGSGQSLGQGKNVLSPKLDVVFQALFGEVGSERITGRFIKSILKEEISEVDLSQNVVLRRERKDDKLGILDVFAKINEKEYCNIEMQIDDTGEIKERMLYYWSRIYSRQLKKNERYGELQKTIAIFITNFEMKGLEGLEYHTEWKIIDEGTRKVILTDKLEFHIIEIPKVKRKLKYLTSNIGKSEKKEEEKMEEKKKERDELLDWVQFLQEPLSEYVLEKTKDNPELKEAVEKLKEISEDEKIQRIAWLREKAILDENSRKDYAERKGREEGMREARLEDAKRMLEKGIDIKTIIEITGLSKEEIEKSNN